MFLKYLAYLVAVAFLLFLIDSLLRLFIKQLLYIISSIFKHLGFASTWARLEELFADENADEDVDVDVRVLKCSRCDQRIMVKPKGLYTCSVCRLEFYWEAEKEPFLVSSGGFPDNLFFKAELGDVSAQYELAKKYSDGQVSHRDLIQAYKWANITSSATSTPLIKLRDKIVGQIAPTELELAKELVSQFKPKEPPHVLVTKKEKIGCVWSFVIYSSSLFSVMVVFFFPFVALLENFPVVEAHLSPYAPLVMIVLLRIIPDYTNKLSKAAERAIFLIKKAPQMRV